MTVLATFRPQAWLNDQAIGVHPDGPTSFDVTSEVEAMGREQALALKDDSCASDHLKESPAAPAWVRGWSGPFYIEVQEAIAAHFAQPELCQCEGDGCAVTGGAEDLVRFNDCYLCERCASVRTVGASA